MNAPTEKNEAQLNYELVVALKNLRAHCDSTINAVGRVARGADYTGDGDCVLSAASMDLHYAIGRAVEAERALARYLSGE